MGTYYALIPMFSPALEQGELKAELDLIRPGLTYTTFLELDEAEQQNIVSQMSQRTIDLMLQEAKKHNSFVSEGTELILTGDSLKLTQIAKFTGTKGNQVSGKAMIAVSDEKKFLRFEEFSVTNGPSLHVYLTKAGDVSSGFDLGRLKANQGDQNYDISNIDTRAYKVVVIYSNPFGIYFASAALPDAGL